MSETVLPSPPRSRALLGLLAALLINGLWLLLLQLERQPARPVASRLIELRLLAEPVPLKPQQLPRAPTRAALQVPAPEVVLPPQVPSPAQVSTTVAPAAPVAAASVPAGPAPLKLALPVTRPASGGRPESMLSQMLNDPRANSVKRTVEYAVADAAGTLPITVSSATDGTNSKFIRQGSKCIRVSEARTKTLNPMDENSRGTPSMSGACTKD